MSMPFIKRSVHLETVEKLSELTQEYQNFRRRNAEVRDQSFGAGQAAAIQAFLPVYDNLLRALEQPCNDAAYAAGIEMTMRSLKKALEALDITEIPALGEPFDPNIHEAMEHIQDENFPENTVSKVVLTGFSQGKTVLRHALVIVAN